MEKYILVIDIGTTNVKASLVDKKSDIFCSASSEFPLIYQDNDWVEESGSVIWGTTQEMIRKVITKSEIEEEQIDSIGITNQRETFLLWDKKTGVPVYNAIGWQDQRGMPKSKELMEAGKFDSVFLKTGQFLANFMPSGAKVTWVLDQVPGVRERAQKGELAFGTLDTWMIWNLTNGDSHLTDVSNASRTLFFDINNLCWDDELLQIFSIPKSILPTVKASGDNLGMAKGIFHKEIPIHSALGDAHAATLGQGCTVEGRMKATYGTTCVMSVNIGHQPKYFPGLATTVGWKIKEDTTYLYEAGYYTAGLPLKWLRDVMQMATDFETMNQISETTERTEGLYVCPTFLGIATPHFCGQARGLIAGLNVTNGPRDIIKATMDSNAYATKDCVETVAAGMGKMPLSIAVDGGVSKSDYMMQFVADMSGIEIERGKSVETTTLGAAYAAGLTSGFWKDYEEIYSLCDSEKHIFHPSLEPQEVEKLYNGWKKVVAAALNLAK